SISYVSTNNVVWLPMTSTWALKAAISLSCNRVKECAEVPAVLMPYRKPAARLEVDANPAMVAARAAATAASSCARRDPISIHGRVPADMVIRDAAEATEVS